MWFGLLTWSIVGTPATAWAASSSSASVATPPSPYPNPAQRRLPASWPPGQSLPAPAPLTPPTLRVADDQAAKAVAWFGVPDGSNALTPTMTSAAPHPQAARADTPLRPRPDLSRSLVYSGALALVIAGSGLVMLGTRRRLW
jgi:hypothetical protein